MDTSNADKVGPASNVDLDAGAIRNHIDKFIVGDHNTRDAEDYFRAALDIAQRQRAKSWEFRPTLSLARLLASKIVERRRTLYSRKSALAFTNC